MCSVDFDRSTVPHDWLPIALLYEYPARVDHNRVSQAKLGAKHVKKAQLSAKEKEKGIDFSKKTNQDQEHGV